MSSGKQDQDTGTFWDHLDVLRSCLIRIACVVILLAVVAFCFKETLFSIVLAPVKSDFITYQLLGGEEFALRMINTGLTEQFMVHIRVAAYVGLLLASPFVLYQLFLFVAPALYEHERRYAVRIVSSTYVMFIAGTLVNYFLIFPLTVKFLGTYQVSPEVTNMLTIQSYADTLLSMSLVIGLVFELPVLCWLLSKMHLLKSGQMRHFRKHSIVAILVLSAVITPSGDAFTMCAVALPIWLLYELSIWIVRKTNG